MKKKTLSHLSSEKRTGQDRRQKKVLKHVLHGKRGRPRRQIDQSTAYYVDQYGHRSATLIGTIVVLSITDAFFTLFLIKHGAVEINPVMAFFLEVGPIVFFVSKYFLTSVSVMLLLVNKNTYLFKTKIRAKHLFLAIVAMFLLVILWEIFLVFQVCC